MLNVSSKLIFLKLFFEMVIKIFRKKKKKFQVQIINKFKKKLSILLTELKNNEKMNTVRKLNMLLNLYHEMFRFYCKKNFKLF